MADVEGGCECRSNRITRFDDMPGLESCLGCRYLEEQLQAALAELSSMRLAAKLLLLDSKMDCPASEVPAYGDVELNNHVKSKKLSDLELHSNGEQTKASHVYRGRDNVSGRKESKAVVTNSNLVQLIPNYGNKRYSKHNLDDEDVGSLKRRKELGAKNIMNRTLLKEKRILVVGDSHVKGMASEIQHKLKKKYAVQGIVKSGADMDVILCSIEEAGKLTSDDFLIVWGGVKECLKTRPKEASGRLGNSLDVTQIQM
jgi:hypothetical protein